VKRYKSGTDRLTDFNLGMAVVIELRTTVRGVERPQVAMHHKMPCFVVCSFVGITTVASAVVTTDVTTTRTIPDRGTSQWSLLLTVLLRFCRQL